MTLIHAALLLVPAVAMGASAVSVSTPVLLSGMPVYSAPLTITTKVAPSGSGLSNPTGSVVFVVDGMNQSPLAIDSTGTATLSRTLAPGTHAIVAQYSGDANYLAGASGVFSLTIGKADSVVTLDGSPPQLNQPVVLRATPSLMNPAAAAAIGTVDFSSGGTAISGCTGLPVQAGASVCNTTFSRLGTISVTASYSGDVNIKPSAATTQFTIGKVVAGTYVAAAPDSPVYGATVTINALLLGAAGAPAPTGGISFVVGPSTLPPTPLGTDGRASLAIPSGAFGPLSAGGYQVAAIYSGDDNYQSSRSQNLTLTVAKATPAVSLVTVASSIAQTTNLKATVTVPGGYAGGTVSMSQGGVSICSGIGLQNGAATCSLSITQAATYNITATYSGDANTNNASAALQFTVGKVDPGITTSYTPSSPAFGAPVILSAVVAPPAGQTLVPTGTVAFTEGATGHGVAPVGADGKASVAVNLAVGTHNIVAIYSGDATYQPATAPAFSVAVGKGATTTTVTATPAQVGQTTTLKAIVVVGSGASATATGTVSMSTGETSICSAVPLQNGSASCSLKILQSGTYTITANFSGDANTAASSGSMQFAASKSTAGVTTAFSPSPAVYGAPVAITAQVVVPEGQPAPGGTVVFTEGATSLGTANVGTDGRATVNQTLGVGSHSIVSSFSGDANYQPVSAPAVTLVVAKAVTSTALSAGPVQIAQAVTLRATVALSNAGTAAISGSVDFTAAGKAITGCTGVAVQTGIALCNTSFGQLGDVSLAANYTGDANTASSSGTLSIAVGKVVAGFYTAANSTSPVYGTVVSVNALLMGAAGVAAPTGTIAFTDGTAALGSANVGSDGRASLVLGSSPPLTVGTHNIGAAYSGDGNYQSGTAPALTIVVAKAASAVVLTSNPPQVSQSLNLKAVVTAAGGSLIPGGSVDFTNGGVAIGGCTGVIPQNGNAYCTTSLSQTGDFTIGAAYSGDANVLPSSASLKLTVGKAAAGFYTASAPTAPVYGVPVTVNALLMGAAGLPAPGGTVTFSDGSTTLATVPVGSDGRASLVLPSNASAPLSAGSHTISASYSGDANYATATATPLNLTVAKASTTTTLTATAGSPLTATVGAASPGAGSPGGIVQFIQGGTILGAANLSLQGSAMVASIANTAVNGSLWAVYQGDANFNGSTSSILSVLTPVQLTITSDRNPSTAGEVVTFTVRASTAAGQVTGTIQLLVDGTSVGTTALSAGQAIFAGNKLAVGSHTVTANYAGDATFAAATAGLQQVVNKSTLSLALASSAASTVFGQAVTFTAKMGTAEGTVQFLDGEASLGSAAMSAGTATFSVSSLAVGTHSVTAAWAESATSAPATSSPLTQTVTKAQTMVTISAADGAWNAVVSALAPGTGTPAGTVKFINSTTGAVLASASLTRGAASAAATPTSDPVVASYAGSSEYLSSTSTALTPLTAANAASYTFDTFAPDELATLFGPNLATSTVTASAGPVTSLGGTTVYVTDSAGVKRAAQLLYVSPEQVSFLVPAPAALGVATVMVVNGKGGAVSTVIQINRVAPGLFTRNSSGKGAPAGQFVRAHLDGTMDPVQDLAVFDKARNEWAPARIDLGSSTDLVYVILYGTGIRHRTQVPMCTVGGLPATVVYAGPQGDYAGLDQVNVALPRSLMGSGSVELKLTIDGVTSNAVTLFFP